MIAGHYVVNGDRHDGLQVSCNSVCIIYEAAKCTCTLKSFDIEKRIFLLIVVTVRSLR